MYTIYIESTVKKKTCAA